MAFVIVHSCGVVYQRVYSVYSISITTRDHCATGKSHENSHERSHTNHHKFPWTIPLIFDLPMNSMVIFPWSQEKKHILRWPCTGCPRRPSRPAGVAPGRPAASAVCGDPRPPAAAAPTAPDPYEASAMGWWENARQIWKTSMWHMILVWFYYGFTNHQYTII